MQPPVHFIGLLPMHPRGKSQAFSTLSPSVLVVTCTRGGDIALFPADGDRAPLATAATSHAFPVTAFAAFHRPQEEHLGFQEKVGRFLSLRPAAKLELDLVVHHAFLSSSSERTITNFLVISHKGEKLFLVADSQGWVTILSRAGTLRRRVKVAEEAGGVTHVVHCSGVVVFSTTRTFAVFSVATMDVSGAIGTVDARSPIASLAIDPTRQTRLAVALEDGQILYYDLKKASLLHKFPSSSRVPTRLIFTKEMIFALSVDEGNDSFLLAFDLREAEAPRASIAFDPPAGAFRPADRFLLENFQTGAVASFFRFGETSLLAVVSRRGDEIRLFEPLSRQGLPPEEEPWFNFRLPILVLALIAVLLFRLFRTNRLSFQRTADTDFFRGKSEWKGGRHGSENFPNLREDFSRLLAKARGSTARRRSSSSLLERSTGGRFPREKRRRFFHADGASSSSERNRRWGRQTHAQGGFFTAHAGGGSQPEQDIFGGRVAPRCSSDSD
ncbi:conserved hypothetical protein [Neospora caninum Liverpool]|uniref:WD domain, G-beta repeat-containing protein n=1 Tax=Neospora caninum (strain Liverpool) TaxID=572307 RepID=F0VDG6_NEOCL|nr:conserved hypothetical protein [Neospora caninum Liverpool]CBZ51759.1 conserved hypothetical protein [Neospora caninum Liverpool]|eukprot:XP_003881792.1 conserved hypothetical protein [Neospora caninum Liverpool]